MRNIRTALVITMILLCAGGLHAQKYIGLVGGVNLSNLNVDVEPPDDQFERITRVGFGAVFGLNMLNNVAIQLEPMFLQKGAKQLTFDDLSGDVEFFYKTTNVEIPVFLKAALATGPIQPFVMAGPTLGINLSTTLEAETAGLKFSGDGDSLAKDFDYGFGFGGGLSLPFRNHALFVEARYTLGLSNINEGGSVVLTAGDVSENIAVDPVDVKNRGVQIMAGLIVSF